MTGHSLPAQQSSLEPPVFPVDGSPSWWQVQYPSRGWPALAAEAYERVDVCIVGAGVTGSSTAYALAREGARVMLLDARSVAGGASGRNGGFLLAGLNVRYGQLVERLGRERAHELYALTAHGRDRLIATAKAIGAPETARQTGSLRLAVDADERDDLDREHALFVADGVRCERLTPGELPDGLGAHFLGGLRFADDGASIPAAWVRALASAAADAGAVIHEHSPVRAMGVSTSGASGSGASSAAAPAHGAHVELANGARVDADTVVVCTEAYLPGLLPELRGLITPYRSQVLAATVGDGTTRVLHHPTWSRRGWDYAQQTESGVVIVGGELIEDQSIYATSGRGSR